jgi:hypothetical protein
MCALGAGLAIWSPAARKTQGTFSGRGEKVLIEYYFILRILVDNQLKLSWPEDGF